MTELRGLPSMNADSWRPVALAPILDGLANGTITGPVPTLMRRTDGVALIYPGEVHSFAGEPESGKSWAAAAACVQSLEVGDRVLYLDFEDSPSSVLARLLALGARRDAILERFTYIRPDTPLAAATVGNLTAGGYALAIVDGLSEAYGLLGLDPEKNTDVAKFLANLPRPLAAAGAAVIQIDHVTKNKENRGRYSFGAQHKLAGVAAAYSFEVINPFSRTKTGTIKILVQKDRHGHVRGHADGGVVALAELEPQDNGARVTFTLNVPDATSATGTFRPTTIMERVSRYIEDNPGAGVKNIRDAVRSKAKHVDIAVKALIDERHVEQRQEGPAKRHYSVNPYRQDTDLVPLSQPCPDLVPDTVEADLVPLSPPLKGTRDRGQGPGDTATASPPLNAPTDTEQSQDSWLTQIAQLEPEPDQDREAAATHNPSTAA